MGCEVDAEGAGLGLGSPVGDSDSGEVEEGLYGGDDVSRGGLRDVPADAGVEGGGVTASIVDAGGEEEGGCIAFCGGAGVDEVGVAEGAGVDVEFQGLLVLWFERLGLDA